MLEGRPHITPRQLEVLRLVVQGRTIVEIGQLLNMSRSTIHHHMSSVRTNFGTRRLAQLVIAAVHYELITPGEMAHVVQTMRIQAAADREWGDADG